MVKGIKYQISWFWDRVKYLENTGSSLKFEIHQKHHLYVVELCSDIHGKFKRTEEKLNLKYKGEKTSSAWKFFQVKLTESS